MLQILVLVSPRIKNPVIESEIILVRYQKIRTVITNPGIDSFNVRKANIVGGGKLRPPTHLLLNVYVVYEQVDCLMRRESCHHLQEYLFHVADSSRPGFGILGPCEPRSCMAL